MLGLAALRARASASAFARAPALIAVAGRRGLAGKVVAGARRRAPPKAVLEMTPNAARRISDLLSRQQGQPEPAVAVRIGVKTRGCNGMSYTMNYADKKAKFDEEVEQHGVRIFVESKALMHVIGTTMDFVEDDTTSEFIFHNPNAEASCGCGESFTTDKQPGS